MDEFMPSLYSHAKCKAHYVASMACIVRCRSLKREKESSITWSHPREWDSSSPQSWLHHAFLWRLQGDGKPSGSNEAGSCCLRSTAMHAGQPDRITAYLKHFKTNMENSELRQAVCSGAFMHVFNLDNHVMETIHTYHLSIVCMKALVKCYLWWPRLNSKLKKLGIAYVQCQKEQTLPAVAPLHSWLGSTTLWAYIHLDTAGLFKDETARPLLPQIQGGQNLWKSAITTASQTVTVLRTLLFANGFP